MLTSVLDKGNETSLANFPFLTCKADDADLKNETKKTAKAILSKEGFFFFDVISAVESKWKPAKVFGPDAQPVLIDKQITGTVSMFVNWNKTEKKLKRVNVEIE